jgi:hypothetical protein
MLVLQFLSMDKCVQADCQARGWTEEDCRNVAIFTGRHPKSADETMLRSLKFEVRDGEYVRFDRSVYDAQPHRQIAAGACRIYAFDAVHDCHAFCLLSGALRARFARAMSLE